MGCLEEACLRILIASWPWDGLIIVVNSAWETAWTYLETCGLRDCCGVAELLLDDDAVLSLLLLLWVI